MTPKTKDEARLAYELAVVEMEATRVAFENAAKAAQQALATYNDFITVKPK